MSLSSVAEVLAFLSLAVWLVLFFLWGSFWRIWEYDADHTLAPPLQSWPSVVAVIPARNEAASIAPVVAALAKQDYPGEFHAVIVDDHSEDGTADLARQSAQETALAARIQITSAPELAPGWTGKLWALNSGVAASDDSQPEFLWFTDADVIHAPDTLRRLVSRAERDGFDLSSLMVLLESRTFAERLLIPPFLYFFLMLYPPNWISDERSKIAGAAGGCILIRPSALERIGGLAIRPTIKIWWSHVQRAKHTADLLTVFGRMVNNLNDYNPRLHKVSVCRLKLRRRVGAGLVRPGH